MRNLNLRVAGQRGGTAVIRRVGGGFGHSPSLPTLPALTSRQPTFDPRGPRR
jgi:hypothetical protein